MGRKKITLHGYALRYADGLEFGRSPDSRATRERATIKAMPYRDKDGTSTSRHELHLRRGRKDTSGLGYARYHDGSPKDIRILGSRRTKRVPTSNTTRQRANARYPLRAAAFWVSVKRHEMDPKAPTGLASC